MLAANFALLPGRTTGSSSYPVLLCQVINREEVHGELNNSTRQCPTGAAEPVLAAESGEAKGLFPTLQTEVVGWLFQIVVLLPGASPGDRETPQQL